VAQGWALITAMKKPMKRSPVWAPVGAIAGGSVLSAVGPSAGGAAAVLGQLREAPATGTGRHSLYFIDGAKSSRSAGWADLTIPPVPHTAQFTEETSLRSIRGGFPLVFPERDAVGCRWSQQSMAFTGRISHGTE